MSLDNFLKQTVIDAVDDLFKKRLDPILKGLYVTAISPPDQDPNLTREQAAAYLGLAKTTLAIMASQKRGPPYYKIGRSVRYRQSDLSSFLEEHRCLIGRRGRPPVKPIAVATNGSVHKPLK
jgi:excisionase family DNA binding protein